MLGETLRDLGVNRGHKSQDDMDAHLAISKKKMGHKWLRAELRKRFGDDMLVSAGVNKRIIRKDKKAAAWAVEKHRREKEKRAKDWDKYIRSLENKNGVNAKSFGLENAAGNSERGR